MKFSTWEQYQHLKIFVIVENYETRTNYPFLLLKKIKLEDLWH